MSVRRTPESPLVWLPFRAIDARGPLLTMVTGQVGKALGERWKALNDKQRAPYEAKAAQDKKRYEDEKTTYNVSSHQPVGCPPYANKQTAKADAEEEESS